MINISGLHKFFNKGRRNEIHVVNNITLDLPEKGMVAVFGKSGCGKTTLLNVIGGLDKFSKGSLKIKGKNIKSKTDVIRNKYIGYIFQNYNLNKNETCYENVANSLRLCGIKDEKEIENRVMVALKNVGMEKFYKRSPDTLSGGQQQRIAIARAIVKNPEIILADEPTGNLDETNTLMIMDLLKSIAKNRLVLLVSHEERLVDYYCDTIIELQDGKVVGTRKNSVSADGYDTRSKNDIYLGELSRRNLSHACAEIEYYGETPPAPVKLKIINNDGKLYLQIDTTKVQILSHSSEVKVHEGVYKKKEVSSSNKEIDMSALPPIKGRRFGRLFSLKSAIKSGFASNFKNNKKGKKALLGTMFLFAGIIVLVTAMFSGNSIGKIIEARDSYNHNVFYVDTQSEEVSIKLNDAVGKEDTGIDYVRLNSSRYGDISVIFSSVSFETFNFPNINTNAVLLDSSLALNRNLVCGKQDNLSNDDVLISTKVADALLEQYSYGNVKGREDLIGLKLNNLYVEGANLRVVGVVESNETAVYLSAIALAKYVNSSNLTLASDANVMVEQGEAILSVRNLSAEEFPKVGDTIKIKGRDIKIVAVNEDYNSTAMANPGYTYIVNENDYITFSKQYGETTNEGPHMGMLYTIIHSNNPAKTTAWLNSEFSALASSQKYAVVTPDMLYQNLIDSATAQITSSCIILLVIFVLMGICIYFIMRSSLMIHIKEVGVYRAIGVSKKNMLFKFFIETIVLTTLTAFIGYILASALIFFCIEVGGAYVSQMLYYPLWLAGVVLAILYFITIVFGILPIRSLLRKTPSEILSKYDI